ncbi:hypothetical protein MNBD_GAMMA10-1611 [hydrothermal vent metagenome]|uniref:DUF72 domain-containing protein n=1 Tax=hydrothermal vent metagenome TaxID=652676 RepID=A0A3B0Y4E7_9ZZZZ
MQASVKMSNSESNEASTLIVESIKLGACGWNHAHWQGGFYPDDLPLDWRLSYYSNEFSAVLLTEKQWRENFLQLEALAFDVDEHFGFYLQSRAPLKSEEQNRLSEVLGSKLATVVNVCVNGVNTEIDHEAGVAVINMASKDMRGWRQWLEQHGASLRAIFLKDESPSCQQMSDFNALLELMGL